MSNLSIYSRVPWDVVVVDLLLAYYYTIVTYKYSSISALRVHVCTMIVNMSAYLHEVILTLFTYKSAEMPEYIYIYIYSQLPVSRTRKGPRNVSELARCPTYPIFKRSCK